MMTVYEYASDMNRTVDEILNLPAIFVIAILARSFS